MNRKTFLGLLTAPFLVPLLPKLKQKKTPPKISKSDLEILMRKEYQKAFDIIHRDGIEKFNRELIFGTGKSEPEGFIQ